MENIQVYSLKLFCTRTSILDVAWPTAYMYLRVLISLGWTCHGQTTFKVLVVMAGKFLVFYNYSKYTTSFLTKPARSNCTY